MDELIEQFLLESRELVEQATGDLLALERNPVDADRLDSVLRSFHTLKGGAGIVDFSAMASLLHAVEDVLSASKSGRHTLGTAAIGDCLSALDRVVQWLDHMEKSGVVPENAGSEAANLITRLLAGVGPGGNGGVRSVDVPAGNWIKDLIGSNPPSTARTALRYRPLSDSFFRNADPLDLIARLPGLLKLAILPAGDPTSLEELDPFSCEMTITALLSAPVDAVAGLVREIGLEESQAIELSALSPAGEGFTAAARAILQEQVRMLEADKEESLPALLASAHRVAVNVLTKSGYPDTAARLTDFLHMPPAEATSRLIALIEQPIEEPDTASSSIERKQEGPATTEAVSGTLRVSIERIDALVNLVGELTVAKNALDHAAVLARQRADPDTLASLLADQQARLDKLVSQLQRSVLSIRVLPMRHVFQRFPRLVRDLSLEMNKRAVLVTNGEETEADKAIVEALGEPLLHVVRNAVDHGIETPEERLAAGKPEMATIRLGAARISDDIVVEVEDDGRGIDLEKVRRIAIERGQADGTAPVSDTGAIELLFASGFSTAETVSTVSGRGVGMAAVRSAIERMGGTVAVESEPGLKTTVRFVLPFSIMMTSVMTVEAAGQVFGIPLETVVETVRVPRSAITSVGKARLLVHRDRAVPVVDLAAALGAEGTPLHSVDAAIVIAAADAEVCGFQVDRIGGRLEVMLKPVEGLLAGLGGLAGVTILGDGRIMLVLDVAELMQ